MGKHDNTSLCKLQRELNVTVFLYVRWVSRYSNLFIKIEYNHGTENRDYFNTMQYATTPFQIIHLIIENTIKIYIYCCYFYIINNKLKFSHSHIPNPLYTTTIIRLTVRRRWIVLNINTNRVIYHLCIYHVFQFYINKQSNYDIFIMNDLINP